MIWKLFLGFYMAGAVLAYLFAFYSLYTLKDYQPKTLVAFLLTPLVWPMMVLDLYLWRNMKNTRWNP